MRRLAQIVGLAFTLVVPRVHAQAPVYTFGVPPLVAPRHPALVPGGRLGARVPPEILARAWADSVLARRLPFPIAPPSTALRRPSPPAVSAAPSPPAGSTAPLADIGMNLNLRLELKADQFRNLRCTSQELQGTLSGCNSGFPTITPNPQYAIRTAGIVGQRLHVDVDFDSQREFDANNNLHVWYEGLEDEVLRRVEAGNVTFQAPPSRFITAQIPANNFGVQAIAQVGALELRGIVAQQKGNIVKDRFYTVGDVTSQSLDREARDLDYESGRFFFVIDPAALPGYPAIDILQLDLLVRPDSLTVGALRVYRRRAIAPSSNGNQNAGGVRAVACGPGLLKAVDCSVQREGPFEWEILQEGKDYYVDATGAWFALANRLDQSDYLAVSYITASRSDSVGTFPVDVRPDTAVVDTLRLVYDPKPGVAAASPTFRFEIRSAYRVGGREIDRTSVALALSVNQRERGTAGDTYLQRLGVALQNDPTQFDQYNRLFPRDRDPNQGEPVRDQFIIFPHLTPFADSAQLSPTERNDSLYRTPRAYLATQGPPSVFALHLHAAATASVDRSLLSLNSFQIREGSEKLYLGTRLLTRDTDYLIDYTTGQVQFKNPDALFQGGSTQIRAQFEERAAFAIAPTTTYGLAARYDLGATGQVNLLGIFQNEQSTFTRPPLGFEPASGFIGGMQAQLRFQPEWLTRAMDALPGVHTSVPSALSVNGELAISKPSPNKFGQAYIEEFEGGEGRSIILTDNTWHWASIPTSVRGAEPLGFVTGFDPKEAAFLTWQSLPYQLSGGQLVPMQFLPQQIDPTLRFTGQAQAAEPVLWLTLKPDSVLGPHWTRPPQNAPRWRSITQTLSATGIDLSRVEFLEFWVWEDAPRTARANNTTLLFDFGSTFEDALAFVPDSFSVSATGDTTYSGSRRAGVGRLDSERDPVTQTWSATINDEGILSDRVTDGILDVNRGVVVDTLPLCSATQNGQLVPYVLGDVRSRCGRHNNAVDTEDQDGDFALDSLTGVRTAESFVRYVFPIGDPRYFVRDGGMNAGAGWRLYRIPFRTDTLQIGSPPPSLRQVQSLRITVVAPAPTGPETDLPFALSRVRLVGSSWVKRSDTPIAGVGGDRGTGIGQVVASVVSTENQDLGYTSPPGVIDEASRRNAAFDITATEINERSMRVLATGLALGNRAEAYLRFTTEGDKNFLKYRTLRVWARGRGVGWEEGDLEFFIKAGKDQNNFYMYHVPAHTTTWQPEVVVQFERWLALRARIEQAWLRGDTAQVYPGCADSSLLIPDSSYVMCDGPYIAHVHDPGTAPPNLARVQEIAAGIWRTQAGTVIDQAELWVDDIRLGDVVRETGAAGSVDIALAAADVADLAVSLSRRDGQFRQLTDDPSYVTDNSANVSGTVRVDRFLPQRWGLSVPVTFQRRLVGSEPFYLSGTDLLGEALPGLRTPRASSASYTFAARRIRQATSGIARWLLDPLSLFGTYTSGDARTSLSRASGSGYAVNVDYTSLPAAKVARVAGIRLRINPSRIHFRSGIAGSDAERFTYLVPIAQAGDTAPPALAQTRTWQNAAGVQLAPVTGVQLGVDAVSTRDLRDYGDSTTMGRLIRQQRATLFGSDIGLETQRLLTTMLSLTPRIAGGWIRPRASVASSFVFTRDPNARQPLRSEGDTAGPFRVPAAFTNTRRFETGAQLDARRLAQALFGDSARVVKLLGRITGLDVTYAAQLGSSFSRATETPSAGYQFALGGFDGFRQVDGLLATSAAHNTTLSTGGGAVLPLGVRATATYRRTNGIVWILRTDQQVPITSRTREWPNGTLSWSFNPSPLVGKLASNVAARVGYRRVLSLNAQPAFDVPGAVALNSTLERTLTPSASVTWIAGVFTSFDLSRTTSDRLTAGNLFRSVRQAHNGTITFSFRPPIKGRWRSNIRTTAGYSVADNTTCLRRAGQDACVPYVDSRQTQAQLTMDTDLPNNVGAGLQMAYVLNEERQTNRKIAQFVLTAFVQLSTSVGQIR